MTFEEAKRKARYGHRDYIGIPVENGVSYEPLTARGVKAALLSVGTKGQFYTITGSNAVLHRHSWRAGLLMLRNARHIGIAA